MEEKKPLGLYIHIPFCLGGKCPYCDFYSLPYDAGLAEQYIEAARRCLREWGEKAKGRSVDTIYFGGGTPSLLGEGLVTLLEQIHECFTLTPDAEITLEANPASVSGEMLTLLRSAGFNRLSLGMQSACEAELSTLGRKHTAEDTKFVYYEAREAGFNNISLDLMLCLPGQSMESIRESVDFASALGAEHLSAYLLKIEEGTPFYKKKEDLLRRMPDDDGQAETYLAVCELLGEKGYRQYEISNFARDGRVSRHNLKYWNCEEYLGIGPSAHSYFEGERFYYPRDLAGFVSGAKPIPDGRGGSMEEYLMLRLRLTEGVTEKGLRARFNCGLEALDAARIKALVQAGLAESDELSFRLTPKGFAVSNSVIGYLIF